MEMNRGRLVRVKRWRVRKLVVGCVQNVLVIACLLLTLYLYRDFKAWTPQDDVHIEFDSVKATSGNTTVHFLDVISSYMMELNEQKDQIFIQCAGFYIWHVHVCYRSLSLLETGELQLHVAGSAVSSFELSSSQEVCKGLHSIVYLRNKQRASLHTSSITGFKISNLTMGLRYLQGNKCVY